MLSSAPTSQPLDTDAHAVIARVVDEAPPLTHSARARLAALLHGSGQPDHLADKLKAIIQGRAA